MRQTPLQFAIFIAFILTSGAASAQEPPEAPAAPSSGVGKASSAEDAPPPKLSISAERIRELLEEPSTLQQSLDQRPTFRIKIEERDRLRELLHSPDPENEVAALPPPPGGLYGYEQQRIALGAIDHNGTRMEPYAVFSGQEMLTLAIEGLLTKYLGGRALSALTDNEQAQAEAAARADVARAVRQYCASQPGYGAGIAICVDGAGR